MLLRLDLSTAPSVLQALTAPLARVAVVRAYQLLTWLQLAPTHALEVFATSSEPLAVP